MRSQKNECKKFSELKNFTTQSMPEPYNVSVRQCQHLVNTRVTYHQNLVNVRVRYYQEIHSIKKNENSKKNEMSKKKKVISKKMKRKNCQDLKMLELNQYQCQTMSMLQNVSLKQCQDLVNARLR